MGLLIRLRKIIKTFKKFLNPDQNQQNNLDNNNGDQLFKLPSEILLQILSKLDLKTLCRCTIASPKFLPFISHIHTLSTPLPSSLILFKSPVLSFKVSCYIIALLQSMCLLYFVIVPLLLFIFRTLIMLFFGLYPYNCLLFLATYRPIRVLISRLFARFLALCYAILIHPMFLTSILLVFRVVRYVILHRFITVPIGFLLYPVGLLFDMCVTIAIKAISKMYFPRVSASGREFLQKLTNLNTFDVTLPSRLLLNNRGMWIRGEHRRVGEKCYNVFVSGYAKEQRNEQGHNNVANPWSLPINQSTIDSFMSMAALCIICRFLLDFPVPMEQNCEVVSAVASKNRYTNTKVRFYCKKRLQIQSNIGESMWFVRMIKALVSKIKVKSIVFWRRGKGGVKFFYVPSATIRLNHGSIQVTNAYLCFAYRHDNEDFSESRTNDFIKAWLDGSIEEEACEDVARKELKEAVRVMLNHPHTAL